MFRRIKRLVGPLARLPIHPQWLMGRATRQLREELKGVRKQSVVLDIGCFNKWPAQHIPESCVYIGLDYYLTASTWYQSQPDVYGTALSLPIDADSVDVVLLLDVLEHLQDAERALAECRRVLAPGGQILIQLPYLYPLHDEPRDFARYSVHGFNALAERLEFTVDDIQSLGHPLETAALLNNLAFSKSLLNWTESWNPLALLALAAPLVFLWNNLLARGLSVLSRDDAFMPMGYRVTLTKPGA